MKEPLVSIVIRTLNEEKLLFQTLQAIQNQTYKNYEIIIVDSGSTDQTLHIAHDFPVSIYFIKPEDFTFGYSLNLGAEKSKGEYIVNLSAHCVAVDNYWLENLIRPFKKHDKIVGVYGKQTAWPSTHYLEKKGFQNYYKTKDKLQIDTYIFSNANAAIKKSIWIKYKFNEKVTYSEDQVWAKLMISEGYYLYYSAKANVYHSHDETFKQVTNRVKREIIEADKMRNYHSRYPFIMLMILSLKMILTGLKIILIEKDKMKNFMGIINLGFGSIYGEYLARKNTKHPWLIIFFNLLSLRKPC